jgi:hypothetical protein
MGEEILIGSTASVRCDQPDSLWWFPSPRAGTSAGRERPPPQSQATQQTHTDQHDARGLGDGPQRLGIEKIVHRDDIVDRVAEHAVGDDRVRARRDPHAIRAFLREVRSLTKVCIS